MRNEHAISIAIVSEHKLLRDGLVALMDIIDYPVQSIISAATAEEVFNGDEMPAILLLQAKQDKPADLIEQINSILAPYPGLHLLALLSGADNDLMKQLEQSNAGGYLFIYAEPEDLKGRKYYQPSKFKRDDFDNISSILRSFFD